MCPALSQAPKDTTVNKTETPNLTKLIVGVIYRKNVRQDVSKGPPKGGHLG